MELSITNIEAWCPKCQRAMIERENKVNGSHFLGCSGWPDDCGYTMKVPEYVKLRRAGAAPLPGFD